MEVHPTGGSTGWVLAEIPEQYLASFHSAGAQYGVSWYVLGVNAKAKSDFNTDALRPPNYTGELAEGFARHLSGVRQRQHV